MYNSHVPKIVKLNEIMGAQILKHGETASFILRF